jgi:uncharacterized protein (TIGR03032 family)
MGLAATAAGGELRLAIATFHEVVVLGDAPLLAAALPGDPGRYRHLLVPRGTLFSGDIDAHDLVWIKDQIFVANTRFDCIARLDAAYSFTPVWTPPFVTQNMPEDRCHLNGLAVADGRVAYATALGQSDIARGWSAGRATGGVLLDVPGGTPVLDGLCMPHSPRVFDDTLYVLDSGTGRILQVDARARVARPLAELPGFTRGLDRLGDVLFVGLSRIRDTARVKLPIQARSGELFCGVAAVERTQGKLLGWARFDDSFEEVFDVKVLPDFRQGAMLGVDDQTHRRALVLRGRAFWGEKVDDITARPRPTDDENHNVR